MKRQDIISIAVTFVVGFLLGGYFYLTNFAGFASEIATPNEQAVSEFVIVADVYGGCRNACPSFQIVGDGSYRYLHTPFAGAERVTQKGELPSVLKKRLVSALTKEEVRRQSVETEPTTCNSYSDGIDVKYEITLNGAVYILDSCGTKVDTGSLLWQSFQSVWVYLESEKK